MTEHQTPEELAASTDRWMKWGAGVMVLLVVVFPLYRLVEPDARSDRAETLAQYLATQGRDLYASECSECHGIDGERGEKAPTLNAAQFLLTTTNDRMATLISVGVPGTDMKAFDLDFGGRLTSEQIKAITAYLRSLEDDSPDLPDWREYPGN